jgi:hypothetical protein
VLTALLMALAPIALIAATPFNDLNPGSPHNANIDAIYTAGITTGCVPDVSYCPNDLVTREQMASFLARTAGLGGNPPVANAKSAQTAASASTVGGFAPNGLVRVARATAFRIDASPTPSPLIISAAYPAAQDVVSVALTAPAAGFVLVTGTVVVSSVSTYPSVFRLRDPITGETSPLLQVVDEGNSVAVTYIFPVNAGDRTFALQAAKTADTGTVQLVDATITALFVPFGSTGGTTLDLP